MYKLNKRILRSSLTAYPFTDKEDNSHYDSPAKSSLFVDVMVKQLLKNHLNCATDDEIMYSVETLASLPLQQNSIYFSPSKFWPFVRKLSNRKAPGIDEITNCTFK